MFQESYMRVDFPNWCETKNSNLRHNNRSTAKATIASRTILFFFFDNNYLTSEKPNINKSSIIHKLFLIKDHQHQIPKKVSYPRVSI